MKGKTILVTGASTGLGEEMTKTLVGRGHRVLAGVRRPQDGARLAAALGDACVPLILDVTRSETISGAVEAVRTLGGLDGLANNAGIAVSGPLEFLPLDELRRQFEVNVFGVIAVTQALAPFLVASRGRIAIVGSVAGRNAMPIAGPYCASKHAIEALAACLRMELLAWGVHVALIEPGSFRTPLWDRSDAAAATAAAQLPPDALARYGDTLLAVRRIAARAGRRGTDTARARGAFIHLFESPRPRRRYVIGQDARLQLLLGALPMAIREPFLTHALGLRAAP